MCSMRGVERSPERMNRVLWPERIGVPHRAHASSVFVIAAHLRDGLPNRHMPGDQPAHPPGDAWAERRMSSGSMSRKSSPYRSSAKTDGTAAVSLAGRRRTPPDAPPSHLCSSVLRTPLDGLESGRLPSLPEGPDRTPPDLLDGLPGGPSSAPAGRGSGEEGRMLRLRLAANMEDFPVLEALRFTGRDQLRAARADRIALDSGKNLSGPVQSRPETAAL
jgi:hypothetical protein